MRTVYLSGPMENVSDEDGKGWRNEAISLLIYNGVQGIDPYNFGMQGRSDEAIIREDLYSLSTHQGMITNASQNVPMWGTPMEVYFAWQNHIPTVAFLGNANSSPWLRYHTTAVVGTLEEAVEKIMEYL